MKTEEEWKLFQSGKSNDFYVSNLGRILSVIRSTGNEHIVSTKAKSNSNHLVSEFGFKAGLDMFGGVRRISLSKIVATMFVSNPKNLKFVGNKDGDSNNCKADNLFWASRNKSKPVFRVSNSGDILDVFETAEDACIQWNLMNGNDTQTPTISPAVSKSINGRYLARNSCYIPQSEILSDGLEAALKRRMKPVKPSKTVYMPSNAMKTYNYADRKADIGYNDVFNIRISDNTEAELAEIYGVHRQLISEIKRNKCYKWAK